MGYTVTLISWYIIIIQCFVSLTRVLWKMMIHEDWYWTENKLTFGATNEKALQHSNIYILIYAFFLDIYMYFMEWTCTFKLWSNAMIKKEDKCKLHLFMFSYVELFHVNYVLLVTNQAVFVILLPCTLWMLVHSIHVFIYTGNPI